MKEKEIMSNGHRLEETRETWQQNATWAPKSDAGTINRH